MLFRSHEERAGDDYFKTLGIPVEAVARERYELWLPESCPLCDADEPLEDVAMTQRP